MYGSATSFGFTFIVGTICPNACDRMPARRRRASTYVRMPDRVDGTAPPTRANSSVTADTTSNGEGTFARLFVERPARRAGGSPTWRSRSSPAKLVLHTTTNGTAVAGAWRFGYADGIRLRPDASGNHVKDALVLPPTVLLSYQHVPPGAHDEPSVTQKNALVVGTRFVVNDVPVRGLHDASNTLHFTPIVTPSIEPLVVAHIETERCASGEFAVRGTTRCIPCPAHGVCDGTASAEPGYWRSGSRSLEFYSCQLPRSADSCVAGACKEVRRGPQQRSLGRLRAHGPGMRRVPGPRVELDSAGHHGHLHPHDRAPRAEEGHAAHRVQDADQPIPDDCTPSTALKPPREACGRRLRVGRRDTATVPQRQPRGARCTRAAAPGRMLAPMPSTDTSEPPAAPASATPSLVFQMPPTARRSPGNRCDSAAGCATTGAPRTHDGHLRRTSWTRRGRVRARVLPRCELSAPWSFKGTRRTSFIYSATNDGESSSALSPPPRCWANNARACGGGGDSTRSPKQPAALEAVNAEGGHGK